MRCCVCFRANFVLLNFWLHEVPGLKHHQLRNIWWRWKWIIKCGMHRLATLNYKRNHIHTHIHKVNNAHIVKLNHFISVIFIACCVLLNFIDLNFWMYDADYIIEPVNESNFFFSQNRNLYILSIMSHRKW